MQNLNWFLQCVLKSYPIAREMAIDWLQQWFKIPATVGDIGKFDSSVSPWIRYMIERATRPGPCHFTQIKPVQAGGSNGGEGILLYWTMFEQGRIQYNWENDQKAEDRWKTRFYPLIEACIPLNQKVQALKALDKNRVGICLINFPNTILQCQGSFTSTNLDSDTVRKQVNEEVHNWKPGHLDKAHNRTTKVWDAGVINISNASMEGDQLHQAFLGGTQQHWEVKCPGCGLFHRMRTKWEPERPDLGGLRYDSENCKQPGGEYDYVKLKSTIRYQMPCSYLVGNSPRERRVLSEAAQYSAGDNPGSSRISCTLDGVSVHDLDWLEKLIIPKHQALKARLYGDEEPWRRYLQERECQFFKAGMHPITQNIILGTSKKNRDGLPNRQVRFGAGDYQQGETSKGELPHWWAVIADLAIDPDGKIHLLIVYEGKITTDDNLVAVFKDHEVMPSAVILDSSWSTAHVYQLCLAHGYYAVKGEDTDLFSGHEDGSRKIYSPPKPLHAMVNQPPVYPYQLVRGEHIPNAQEPMFIRYSKFGLMNRVAWLRSSPMVNFEIPSDVSKDFVSHMDSWQLEPRPNQKTLQVEQQWRQRRDRDDLLQCVCYIALNAEDAGFIGGMFLEQGKENK